jgi:Polysaccharide deacetylase
MSPGPRSREPTPEEVRRRRAVAVAVLVTAFAMFVFAVVAAIGGGGGDDGGDERRTAAERPTRPQRTQPARPTTPASGATVPATAPGAHKAPEEVVPILVYDVINTPRADTANPDQWVPREEFDAQMSYLSEQGFHPVTLRQVWAAWKEGGLLPSKPIVISFDTGYHSVYANALPALRSRGWTATLFLAPSQLEADFPPQEVKALVQAGWELDAQGPQDSGETGLAEARQRLQQEFGTRVEFLSYPAGGFDEQAAAEAQSAGFLGAVADEEGLAAPDEPPFELDRIPVRNGFGADGLAQALQAAGVS